MKKIIYLLAIFTLIIAFSAPAMAGNGNGNSCEPGYQRYQGNCVPIPGSEGGGSTGGNITNNVKAYGGNANAIAFGGQGGQGGAGGNAHVDNNIGNGIGNFSPSAKATIEKGAVQNNPTFNNDIRNTNTNLNNNIISNKQSQDQGQAQLQGQGQSQSIKGSGNSSVKNANNAKQNTTVTIEGDKYEASKMHIEGPGLIKSDAKLAEGKASRGKTIGSIMDRLASVTYKQAKSLSKDSDDVEIMKAFLGENDFRVDVISIGDTSGEFMGYIYANSNGADVNAAGMEGKALEAAMYAGMTGIVRVHKDSGKVASGKSWNVGLGGGASIITSGDSVAIAPNGGLGVGGAKASNEELPDMVFEVYFNKDKLWIQKAISPGNVVSSVDNDGYRAGGY
jgi:hypothetical protein